MNFKLNKMINVKNLIIIMSWVGGEEEIWCPPITSWTPRWSVLCETLGERAIFLGSYLNCILLQSAISRAKVYKLKKDSEFYEGCNSNMSFSVAHWTQYLPGVQEVTYSNPVKDWRFFCLLTNGQKAVMLMSLLLVHKSTSPFLLSLFRKELTLNLQSRRYQELPGSIPAIALFFY